MDERRKELKKGMEQWMGVDACGMGRKDGIMSINGTDEWMIR